MLHKSVPLIQSVSQRRGVRPEPRETRGRNERRLLPRTAALRTILPSALDRDGALRRRPRGRRPRSLQVKHVARVSKSNLLRGKRS